MTIGLLKEPSYESRVSLLAEAISSLTKKGIKVLVETGAGERAWCTDGDYEKAGAQVKSREEVLGQADMVLSIHQPSQSEIEKLGSKIAIGVYQPLYQPSLMGQWAKAGLTSFSLDML